MITKQQLDKLAADQPTPKVEPHYRIDGPLEVAVHVSVEEGRIDQLAKGRHVMDTARRGLENNVGLKTQAGFPSARFQEAARIREKAVQLKSDRQKAASRGTSQGEEM